MADLRSVADLAGRELRWVKSNGYELRDGDDVVATLRFRSSWGSLATAESADGCWTFKRVGFLQTRVTIRRCDSEDEIAVFRNNSWTGGGILEFPDGRRLTADTNCWQTKFAFSTETGEPLVRFTKIGGLLKISSNVDILPGAAFAGAPWLVMLGWYVTVQMHNDAAASASAVSVVT